jgi:hypothetical protein
MEAANRPGASLNLQRSSPECTMKDDSRSKRRLESRAQQEEQPLRRMFQIARLLLGLVFVIFGLNGFLKFIPVPPFHPFVPILVSSGYIYFIKAIEASPAACWSSTAPCCWLW